MNPSRLIRVGLMVACCGLSHAMPLSAAELAVLNEQNWDAWVPDGKEVDCIFGDIVLRNDQLVAVIAQPIAGRNANMTVRKAGGAVIDLTRRDKPNDQLSAFYPGAAEYELRAIGASGEVSGSGSGSSPTPTQFNSSGDPSAVEYRCQSQPQDGRAQLEVVYRLIDGEVWLHVVTIYRNPHGQSITVKLQDAIRADRSFSFQFLPELRAFTAVDDWWRQAYGLLVSDRVPTAVGDSVDRGRPVLAYAHEGSSDISLAPGESFEFERRLVPAANLAELQGLTQRQYGHSVHLVELALRDSFGPISNAKIEIARADALTGHGRTNDEGRLLVPLAAGKYRLNIEALARPSVTRELEVSGPLQQSLVLDPPGYVRGHITDQHGRRIPCKIEFRGRDGTPNPMFGPDTDVEAVHNLVYSPHGHFLQEVPPGKYDLIISHGPEFDAEFTQIEVVRGQETALRAQLRQAVETPGWVSSDFHSHSTPSGDNTSSQRGRVLNLLCEHLEFAPCTEHNRITNYVPHLQYFQAESRMATCSGIELTGSPLPVNHQNAFPLIERPRTQDGGGPATDENPVVQVERLALWDHRADKLVQGNHPNLRQILHDRDLDGNVDGGFERMVHSMDVIEVHPPQTILDPATPDQPPNASRNRIADWLQLLNQGYRIPGVVNTDAHYNFHGSGWIRNYLQSPTDEPAQILVADMVHAAEDGRLIMTNGPFLEVWAQSEVIGQPRRATAGQDLIAPGGQASLTIRVQCANWLDINRVMLLINGQPAPDYDFRRRTHPDRFGQGVVKFDQTIPIMLSRDSHLIVVAAGEGLQLGPVVGPDHQGETPIALANPIYLDVDGDGFKPLGPEANDGQ